VHDSCSTISSTVVQYMLSTYTSDATHALSSWADATCALGFWSRISPSHTPLIYNCALLQGLDLLRDLLAIEPAVVLNAAFCERHLKMCPQHEHLEACEKVRNSSSHAPKACEKVRNSSSHASEILREGVQQQLACT